ncbi:MAG: hypothetical protein AAF316_00825 [Cyanobacteria bacterium P01_A01_bin.80]
MTPETNKTSDLLASFKQGFAIATDPTNDVAIQKGGKAITTLNSYWLHRQCSVCSHTFRLGDEVYISEDGKVRHDTALLPCNQIYINQSNPFHINQSHINQSHINQSHANELDFSEETSAFFAGLDKAFPPPLDIPIVRLDTGHYLLKKPFQGFQRHRCVVCSHTFRQNDRVVICPCSPDEPKCKIAVHRDVMHGLNCLEAWNPGLNGQSYCPVTSRKIESL